METLRDELLTRANFSDEEVSGIISKFKTVSLDKKESFLSAGKVSDSIAYVEKGSLIYSQTSPEGDDIAIDFAFEGDFVTYLNSFLSDTASDIDITTNEPSILKTLSKTELYDLYQKYPKMERTGRLLLEEGLAKIAKGRTIFQTMDNQDRYLFLMKHSPHILQRIPQYHVATYLGIKPESLSRIRRNLST
ncbi:Crp/Fnr family transcriptional regulator [Flagellimonas nanhaiensis]|nr:Crp/Fnr family transcriptional regulator [Allomuricauda nanhaiensis]